MSVRGEVDRAEYVIEIVSPRTNTALLSAAEHLFAGLTPQVTHPEERRVALEIAGDADCRRFLARCSTSEDARHLVGLFGSAYPQAELRSHESATFPTGDPAAPQLDEQVAVCTLELQSEPYLPLRTFEDRDIDSSAGSPQADPILGVVAALAGLPPNWRALVQLLVVGAAKPKWAQPFQRLALEHPLERERLQQSVPSFATPLLLLALVSL
jgi:hypothetical protein